MGKSQTEIINGPAVKLSGRKPHVEALMHGQNRMFHLIAQRASLDTILDTAVQWIQTLSTLDLVSTIILTDPESGVIRKIFAPGFPEDYVNLIQAIFPHWAPFLQAIQSHEAVIAENLENDAVWTDISKSIPMLKIRACQLMPLLSSAGTVSGTIVTYYLGAKPSKEDIESIQLIGNTTALAAEHASREEKENRQQEHTTKNLHQAVQENEHLKRLLMNVPALVAVLKGPSHIYEFANQFYIKTVGADREIIGKSVAEAFPELVSQGIIKLLDHVYLTQQQFIAREMHIELKFREDKTTHYYFDFVYLPLIGSEGETEKIMVHAIDVTQQVNAKKALEASEKQVRSMIEQAPVAIALMRGREMTIETVNDLMLELWGKSKKITGLPLLQALPEIKNQVFMKLLEKVFDTGVAHHGYEVQAFLNRNDRLEEAYFNFVYAPVHESDETIKGVIAVGTEVTNQVQVKKALEASEERFRSFILTAPMPLAIYAGADMTIQIANNAMLQTWGKDSSVIGKKLRDALPELEGQPFFQLLDQVYTTGVSYHAHEDRVDLLRGDEMKTFYYNFVYKALHDADGNMYGIINNATDVTPLVHARQKLEETREQLQIAIESSNMGIWSIKPVSNEITFSERFREIFGLPGHVNASRIFACIHPEYRKTAISKLEKAMQPGAEGTYRDEFPITNLKTGRTKVLRSVGKAFFNENDQPYLMVGSILDVTDQKMIERELELRVEERTQALKEANEYLEQFAYVISHDLQEPVRKIRTFSDIIQNRYKNDVPAPARDYIDKIDVSAARVTRLIRDLLDFASVESNQKKHIKTDLNTIIENVKGDFSLLALEKNASISTQKLPVMHVNPVQMNQLFYNLIGNALKFTHENTPPVIEILSRVLTLQEVLQYRNLNPLLRYCQITVRDNGIGFEQQFAETIFGIFQQLHARNQYEGTGTGLAICRKIVDAHRGEMFAEGKMDEGAAFHIILPLEAPDA